MTPGRDPIHDLVDAYLDGRLSSEEQARLLERARQDPSFASMLDVARRSEQALRRSFTPPPQLPLPLPLPLPDDHTPLVRGRRESPLLSIDTFKRIGSIQVRPRWILAAAAAIFLVASAYVLTLGPGASWIGGASKARSGPDVASVYASLKKKSFRPAFACENDEQFATFLAERFGYGAVIQSAENVQIIGWDYADGLLGEATAVILARANGNDLVLFVDEARCKRAIGLPGKGLNMYHRIINGLVFYEITPECDPIILPLIRSAPPHHGGS